MPTAHLSNKKIEGYWEKGAKQGMGKMRYASVYHKCPPDEAIHLLNKGKFCRRLEKTEAKLHADKEGLSFKKVDNLFPAGAYMVTGHNIVYFNTKAHNQKEVEEDCQVIICTHDHYSGRYLNDMRDTTEDKSS